MSTNPRPRLRPPPIANSYWVIDGRLLAGEYPFQRPGAEPSLPLLLDAGINAFLDLTEPEECSPYDVSLPAEVEYLRRPIPDQGLPLHPNHMRQIQDELDDLLRAGRNVYVHCRAGIGRTGTVIGCFLAGQMGNGNAALAELNRLWQQSARSDSWPTVPQTEEQAKYIEEWQGEAGARARAYAHSGADARADEAESAVPPAVRSLRERFQGALIGLAVGDALAAATQYKRPGNFTPVGDLLGGGPFDLPRGAWSDDTAMALCLADSLIERQGFDPVDQIQRYQRWQSEGYGSAMGQCVGITASTARALAQAHWRRQPYAGSHDPKQLDPEVLSRVAPVVLHNYGDAARAVEQAADAARVTCQAPLALDACRLLAAQLHGALRGEPREQFLVPPMSLFGSRPLRPQVLALVEGRVEAGGAGTAGNALAVLGSAIAALRASTNFRAGALAIANAGGSSDVATAVYGQLAGAYYGVAAIPSAWRQALARREEIEARADALLASALVRLGDDGRGA